MAAWLSVFCVSSSKVRGLVCDYAISRSVSLTFWYVQTASKLHVCAVKMIATLTQFLHVVKMRIQFSIPKTVKMPTAFGILTGISTEINIRSESLKASKFIICQQFSFVCAF